MIVAADDPDLFTRDPAGFRDPTDHSERNEVMAADDCRRRIRKIEQIAGRLHPAFLGHRRLDAEFRIERDPRGAQGRFVPHALVMAEHEDLRPMHQRDATMAKRDEAGAATPADQRVVDVHERKRLRRLASAEGHERNISAQQILDPFIIAAGPSEQQAIHPMALDHALEHVDFRLVAPGRRDDDLIVGLLQDLIDPGEHVQKEGMSKRALRV